MSSAVLWFISTVWVALALLATLFVVYLFLNASSRPLFSEPASSVSGAPGP